MSEADYDIVNDPAPEPEPEPIAEPVADVIELEPDAAPADEPVDEPPPVAAGEPKKHHGAVAELIENRRALKETKERLARYESDPVLSRLTPELRDAIHEGRVVVGPPKGSREAETTRLGAVAEKFGLLKADGTPDLDAARRVDTGVREMVREEIAPIAHQSVHTQAVANMNKAIAHAETHGFDVETVREVYGEMLARPNGAKMLAQPEVATTLWTQALGRAVMKGNVPKALAKATPAPRAAADPIVTEPAGRRSSAASVKLTPKVAAVYASAGIDPNTSYSSRVKVTNPSAIELE